MKKIYLLLITAFVVGCSAFSQEGVIDASFGNKGIATTNYNTVSMNGHTSVQQPDGKIIMASGNSSNALTLVRYKTNGTTDNTFGTSGKAVIAAPSGTFLGGTSASLAVQADGKIVYAGNSSDKIVLARLKANGTLDSAFGTAGITYKSYIASWLSQVWKVIVKPDGKIVTGGTATYNSKKYVEVVQFLANGVIDSSFGTNGFYHYTASQGASCFSMALLPNGHILAGGLIYHLTGSMSVFNLLPNGRADSTYGTNGIATCLAFTTYKPILCRLTVQPDNKVLAVGYGQFGSGQGIGVARFKTDGKRDSTFAYQGTLTTTFRNFDDDLPQNVAVQADGKLIISGSSNGRFALMRLKPNGTTDTTYARLGKMLTAMPGTNGIVNYSFMQPDGKMVLTGISNITGVFSFVAGRFEQTPISFYNTIKGNFFSDNNRNGTKDSTEQFMYNIKLTVQKKAYDSLTAMTSSGSFQLDYLDTGAYVSSIIIPNGCFGGSIPTLHTTNYSTYFNTDSVSFAIQRVPCIRDVAVSLSPCARPRPGFSLPIALVYKNVGNDTATGTILFIKSNKVNYNFSNPAWVSVNGDTVRWNYSDLMPQESRTIIIYMTVKQPPAVNSGDSVISTAIINSNVFEANLLNNTAVLRQVATNSYDPNEKIEGHGGKITAAKVASGEYLSYTILFQNTGTDTAINVYIHDSLSNKLDWNSLEMVSASANYQLVMDNGKCVWSFGNIYLPDSNINLAASQGYLTYRIKPKSTVQVGEVIKNTAAIYFDYNLPIITNTETTTIVADAQPLKLISFTAKKEGKTNLLNWTSANEVNVDRFEVERSLDGRDFGMIGKIKAGLNNYSFRDNNPLKATNYYRLKMVDKDGQFAYSPVRMLNNSGSFFVSIYPNPAKDNLQVQVDSYKKTTLQIQVLSADGKVLLSNNTTTIEGSILRSINISSLQKGNYYLKATTAEKDEQVVKFEKL